MRTKQLQNAPFNRAVKTGETEVRCRDGSSTRAINGGPYDMGELVELFADLDTKTLAGCWVGCVIDSVSCSDPPLGGLARVLGIVAHRLHGVEPSKKDITQAA